MLLKRRVEEGIKIIEGGKDGRGEEGAEGA
jgi:hypothetical protein